MIDAIRCRSNFVDHFSTSYLLVSINFTGSWLRIPGQESGAANEYRDDQIAALPPVRELPRRSPESFTAHCYVN
jgi:hypothetical protein